MKISIMPNFEKNLDQMKIVLYNVDDKNEKGCQRREQGCSALFGHQRRKTMQITDVRVRKVSSVGKMKAVVSVTLDNCFVVHDIKVIEGKERLFIAMPSRKTAEGEFKDIAHPINTELRDELQTLILAKYEEALAEMPTEIEE